MKEKLTKEKKKLDIAEKRRKLDLEGYGADLTQMKKKVLFYEKYIKKLKNLVEKDQEGLLEAMQEEKQIDE